MRKYILLIFLVWLALGLSAQNYNNVRIFEFEGGLGLAKGHKYEGAGTKQGGQLFIEVRMNVPHTPWDAGLQFSKGDFDRHAIEYGRKNYIRHETLTTFADYNLRKWKNIAPFAGLGIGFSFVSNEYYYTDRNNRELDNTDYSNRSALAPRIGVELFSRLRITTEYRIMRKEYSYFSINIGGVLGGGYKK